MADNLNSQNIQQQSTGIYPSYTGKEIKRTLEKLCAPVFDFFKKEDKSEEQELQSYTDFEEQLSSEEKKMAMFKEIMDDADPHSRAKINITL